MGNKGGIHVTAMNLMPCDCEGRDRWVNKSARESSGHICKFGARTGVAKSHSRIGDIGHPRDSSSVYEGFPDVGCRAPVSALRCPFDYIGT